MELHGIQYSLIQRITADVAEFNGEVIWKYEGVKLPKKAPYCTVEHLLNGVLGLDKLHAYEASTYNFQIGVFTERHADLIKLQEKVKRVLMGKDIPYYDTNTEPAIINGSFKATVTGITPIYGGDESETKGKHRSYLDVQVFSLNNLQ